MMEKYQHKEAFCLMKYRSDDGKIVEHIWNSRDGVTPFCVGTRDRSQQMTHADWQLDECRPDHVPQAGDRIFIDHTEETARLAAEEYVERHWDDPKMPMKAHPVFEPLGEAGSVEYFIREWVGTVTVVEVKARHARLYPEGTARVDRPEGEGK